MKNVSKSDIDTLLLELDEKYKAWENNGMIERDFSEIINSATETYMLVNNNSTQEELDIIVEQYEWAYPLFQTISDTIDGKLN